jgi:hypothetical protein
MRQHLPSHGGVVGIFTHQDAPGSDCFTRLLIFKIFDSFMFFQQLGFLSIFESPLTFG